MGLSWQQGPLAPGAIGRFLVPEPPPKRLLYVEPLRRRMRVRFGRTWIADSESVLLLFEPDRYPVAYFPVAEIFSDFLAAWSYPQAYTEVGRISKLVSFEPDIVSVQLDGVRLHLAPGQAVVPHGPDRDLAAAEVLPRAQS